MSEEREAFLYRALTINAQLRQLVDDGVLLDRPPESSQADSDRRSAVEDFAPAARQQARRMGEVYELLHCLENSVRELIERTLREAYGPEKWWTEGVPEEFRESAEKRQKEDLKTRWHGRRGDSLLNYVDFPQYGDVIDQRWEHFEELIGDRDWVTHYFAEMNITRRALAHAGSLTETDVERM
ncbi:MAG: Swt1 family HEPN domain-containing protein, partial [Gaiellales bacterium]